MRYVVFILLSTLLFNPSFATSEADTLQTMTGTLYGTLELPEGVGPHPVALIHPGSGPTDRDGNNASLPGKNDSLKLLAEGLLGEGIATLRIDKRGVGESVAAAPSEAALRFETYVADAVAWLGKLDDDARFGNLYVIGHSEGALIGMLSAERVPVQAFVSLSGPGENAADTLRRQLGAELGEEQMQGVDAVLEKLEAGKTVDPLPEAVASIPGIQNLFRRGLQPYLSSWFQYDPAVVVARLAVPVLLVQGTHDLQVRVEDAQRLAEANPKPERAARAAERDESHPQGRPDRSAGEPGNLWRPRSAARCRSGKDSFRVSRADTLNEVCPASVVRGVSLAGKIKNNVFCRFRKG